MTHEQATALYLRKRPSRRREIDVLLRALAGRSVASDYRVLQNLAYTYPEGESRSRVQQLAQAAKNAPATYNPQARLHFGV